MKSLKGYQVEKCEVGVERWLPVTTFCPTTTYTVRNLDEGKQYRFRVRAENMYGVSDPLEGKPVYAKNPFGMYPISTSYKNLYCTSRV